MSKPDNARFWSVFIAIIMFLLGVSVLAPKLVAEWGITYFVAFYLVIIHVLLVCPAYLFYTILRNYLFTVKINYYLLKNKYDEAFKSLNQAIESYPDLSWIKGLKATAMNSAGRINEFENYAIEVLKLPINQKQRLIILCMQNANDYLLGHQMRNFDEITTYFNSKRRRISYYPLAANLVLFFYCNGDDGRAFYNATVLLGYRIFFYKSLAASILANLYYNKQDIGKAREHAIIAMEYAPSDEVKVLLENLHKNVLSQKEII